MPNLLSLPSLLLASTILRIILLLYGLHQDATSPLKYTDIDYLVFTDASRFLAQGLSPYTRETYRYTPLLAHLLLPTTWQPQWLWFSFGKVLFALGDLLATWGIVKLLEKRVGTKKAVILAGLVWGLNPMVATISTRGSSEGLLGAMVVGLLWLVESEQWVLAGALLGWSVHWKIYPGIYGPAVVWWMGRKRVVRKEAGLVERVLGFVMWERVIFTASALAVFAGLNVWMYKVYGHPFLHETYLHHLSRLDHRHNFSPYNILLYLASASASAGISPDSFPWERLAFFPQVLLSFLLLPLAYAKRSLPSTLFAQTFAFVTFNKVCTSQYFMWYLVLLPFYLTESSFVTSPKKGVVALLAWVLGQAVWLSQGYRLEFLGEAVFVPGLWLASLLFLVVNTGILGVVCSDLGRLPAERVVEVKVEKKKL
ncbi:putative mannosyltransferase [Ascobolus immersus RN42]|uniref:GPI mannosyltransferase 1 n=1 Tax=Ascobolus immersus RN42 TaxID=1160509 RepID=A0A3N4I8L2_ASCIM|nr:putative mannosyltransferase [Ascobolus immersus RN42]